MRRATLLLACGAALQACLPCPGWGAAAAVACGGVLYCLGLQRAGRAMPGIGRPLLLRGELCALGAAAAWAAYMLLPPLPAGQRWVTLAALAFYWACALLRCETSLLALEQAEALLERDPAPLARARARLRTGHFLALCLGLAALPCPAIAPAYALGAALLPLWLAAVLAGLRRRY